MERRATLRGKQRVDYERFLVYKLPPERPNKRKESELYPVEIVGRDSINPSRLQVHYIGYSSDEDEYKYESELVSIGDKVRVCDLPYPGHFSLYRELALNIKQALGTNSGRESSPLVRVDMIFDKILFDGGLRLAGKFKFKRGGNDHYSFRSYADLDQLLGVNWHLQGLNSAGDYSYAVLESIIPDQSNFKERLVERGWTLFLCFCVGDGLPQNYAQAFSK